MTAAKRRAIDVLRRGRMLELKHGEIARELEFQQQRLGCGLTTAEIARRFLVPEKTLGQRIFRAKKTLSEAHVPFETPRGDELRKRLESVLSVVYLIFNEGYTATSGDEWMRASLCEDALRLGRMLAEILPEESEVHGLLALMELQASRTAARRRPTGQAVLLVGAGPLFVGPCTDRAGNGCAPACAAAGWRRPQLRPEGGDRCVSRARLDRSGDRLGEDRASL